MGLLFWELRNIYHHHPESKKRKSSEANSGSIHPYGRYGNAVKARKTISTIAILWPVKAIFEKRAATVEVDTLFWGRPHLVGTLSKNFIFLSFKVKNGQKKNPQICGGLHVSNFFVVSAIFLCLSFSSLSLLFDILKLKKVHQVGSLALFSPVIFLPTCAEKCHFEMSWFEMQWFRALKWRISAFQVPPSQKPLLRTHSKQEPFSEPLKTPLQDTF